MRILDILRRIKAGDKIVVSLPSKPETKTYYSLTDGTPVSTGQFKKLRDFVVPDDPGLLEDSEPQSFVWGG